MVVCGTQALRRLAGESNTVLKPTADAKGELPKRSRSQFCFGHTESIAKAEYLVYEKLMENYQNTDPFKYILGKDRRRDSGDVATLARRDG